MDSPHTHPLARLLARLRLLSRVLAVLCCAWIAVVGSALMDELSPDDLGNHRSPLIQSQLKGCEGSFEKRFACSQFVLLDGERQGASALLMRLAVTLAFPAVAWGMWSLVMGRAERLMSVVKARSQSMQGMMPPALSDPGEPMI